MKFLCPDTTCARVEFGKHTSREVGVSPRPIQTKETKLKKKVAFGRIRSCFGDPTDSTNKDCFVLVLGWIEAALLPRLRSIKPEQCFIRTRVHMWWPTIGVPTARFCLICA